MINLLINEVRWENLYHHIYNYFKQQTGSEAFYPRRYGETWLPNNYPQNGLDVKRAIIAVLTDCDYLSTPATTRFDRHSLEESFLNELPIVKEALIEWAPMELREELKYINDLDIMFEKINKVKPFKIGAV